MIGMLRILKARLCWPKHRSIARSIKVLPAPVYEYLDGPDLPPWPRFLAFCIWGFVRLTCGYRPIGFQSGPLLHRLHRAAATLFFFLCFSFVMSSLESAACKGSLNSTAGGSGRASR